MAMRNNSSQSLSEAKAAKKDEWYTQMEDIALEMRYHRKQFEDAVVLCNCDDPYESNFFKYFALNFNRLKLKKLIATCYKGSPVIATQLSWIEGYEASKELNTQLNKKAYKIEITEVPDINGDGAIDITDVEQLLKDKNNVLTILEGDGDFRSQECLELLDEATVVVTNPPFSLFREYVALLISHKKRFLILGNVNAITYKDIFPLIKENQMWMGASIHSGDREFRVPDDYPLKAAGYRVDENGVKYIRVKGVRWWTNLDYSLRHEDLDLYKKYNPEEYPKYCNFDAIEVSKTMDIPRDYYGYIGVPITFLDKYNPDQFEIIGYSGSLAKKIKDCVEPDAEYAQGGPRFYIKTAEKKYKRLYDRIVIKRRDNQN